jgi:hypothetical protein
VNPESSKQEAGKSFCFFSSRLSRRFDSLKLEEKLEII